MFLGFIKASSLDLTTRYLLLLFHLIIKNSPTYISIEFRARRKFRPTKRINKNNLRSHQIYGNKSVLKVSRISIIFLKI